MQTKVQHSAGGIVYRRDGRDVEVAMIQDTFGEWTFAKGHLEPNETLEETAKREISEEMGILADRLQLVRELGEVNYWFVSTFERDAGEAEEPIRIHKFVTYYLFEVPFSTKLVPQEGETQDAAWVSLEELDEKNGYDDNIEIIKKAKAFLSTIAY